MIHHFDVRIFIQDFLTNCWLIGFGILIERTCNNAARKSSHD